MLCALGTDVEPKRSLTRTAALLSTKNLPLSAIVSTLDRGYLDRGGRVRTLAYGSNALVDVLAQNGSIGGGMWWAQDTVWEGIRDLRSIQSCEPEAHDIAKYFEWHEHRLSILGWRPVTWIPHKVLRGFVANGEIIDSDVGRETKGHLCMQPTML
jgi:hypothetical protein